MKRISASPLIRAAIVLAGVGMACGQQPKAASPSKATRQVSIIDPVLQMEAYSLQIPADWIFEATMVPGPSCAPLQNAVYRAVSPDGITQTKLLPGVSWSWGRTPQAFAPAQKSTDCLEWAKEAPAAEFLKYMIGVLQVEYVRDQPVPAPEMAQFQEKIRNNNQSFAARTPPGQPVFTSKGDRAAAIVRYKINSTPVEELLNATVLCNDSPQVLIPRGFGHIHTCTGIVIRSRARQGGLEAMRPVFEAVSKSAVLNQQWMQKWTATVEAAGARARAGGREDEARLLRLNAQMTAAHDVQIKQQQAMQDVTRRGTDIAMKGANDAMNARSGIAHDWADYALDQQKRMDPNTGKITTDSNAYSYTWVNEFGERKQTNEINYNPNGLLKGNWTLQTNVRN
ncbi:MAG: hypothetical protein ABSF62_10815 [Bryobacteraceae bacterium]